MTGCGQGGSQRGSQAQGCVCGLGGVLGKSVYSACEWVGGRVAAREHGVPARSRCLRARRSSSSAGPAARQCSAKGAGGVGSRGTGGGGRRRWARAPPPGVPARKHASALATPPCTSRPHCAQACPVPPKAHDRARRPHPDWRARTLRAYLFSSHPDTTPNAYAPPTTTSAFAVRFIAVGPRARAGRREAGRQARGGGTQEYREGAGWASKFTRGAAGVWPPPLPPPRAAPSTAPRPLAPLQQPSPAHARTTARVRRGAGGARAGCLHAQRVLPPPRPSNHESCRHANKPCSAHVTPPRCPAPPERSCRALQGRCQTHSRRLGGPGAAGGGEGTTRRVSGWGVVGWTAQGHTLAHLITRALTHAHARPQQRAQHVVQRKLWVRHGADARHKGSERSNNGHKAREHDWGRGV